MDGFQSTNQILLQIQTTMASKLLTLMPLLLVSLLAQGVPPSWTRDDFIDAGELKAINFQPFIKSNGTNITNFVPLSSIRNGSQHYNKTNFNSTPRVIVGMKAYGMLPGMSVLGLNPGFRFSITGVNRTNFNYSVTTFNVTVMGLHYQYLAVLGYTELYYTEMTFIKPNGSDAVFDGAVPGVRTSSFTYSNPGGMTVGDNYTSSELVLQVWPYYFLFKPTNGILSLNISAAPASASTYTVTLTATDGCGLQQIGISILYLNKTRLWISSYTQIIDFTTATIMGNTNQTIVSSLSNTTTQYQFRNSAEGITGVYLPFSAIFSPTAWYFNTTSSNLSQLYYKAIQASYRVCDSPNLFLLVDDSLCYPSCPVQRYATNSTFKYCKLCHYTCLQCSSPDYANFCTACNSSAMRLLTNTSCLCDRNYYDNGIQFCAPCDYTCLTCSSNTNTSCLTCDLTLNRGIVNTTCPCLGGYYENGTCFACLNLCLTCSYSVPTQTYQCLSCNSSLFLQIDPRQQSCICFSGYYNNSGICSPCIKGCLACSNGNTCGTCDSGKNWVKNNTDSTCICSDHFFETAGGNGSMVCSACDGTCLTCSNALANSCLSCDSALQRTLQNSTCLCMDGYYQNNTCLSCLNYCLKCLYSTSTSTYTCLSCNSSLFLVLDAANSSCVCQTGYYDQNGTSGICIANSSSFSCGNTIVEPGEQCDDGNVDNLDGCSSTCTVQASHVCLNNLTTASVCYYNGQITLSNEEIFKVPLENRVQVSLLVSAPNCNTTFLEEYLQTSVSLALIPKTRRMLANAGITSQSVTYDPLTNIAKLDFQYSQDIDLTKKQVQFVPSLDFSQSSSRYFYASPSTVLTLDRPDNLLLTTYASQEEIDTAKSMSIAFAGMIGLMWVFWVISICYHQTASAVEFMLVAQIAYQALLQRNFISDGWVGLVIYGKYCYGINVEYSHPAIFDRLRVLSLNSYLLHTLNLSTGLLFLVVVIILAVFCYQTIKVNTEADENANINITQAKIEQAPKSKQEIKDEESQYKIKKGLTLVLFQIGTSFTLLTVKIVVMSLMLVSAATAIDVTIVTSIMGVCYFLVWYFVYKFYQYDFLHDFSFKRLLRDAEDTDSSRSFTGRIGNFFVKYYYFVIFCLLIAFGVIDGLPSLGAPFYIAVSATSILFLLGIIIFGVYFRNAHTVRSVCNLLALCAIMVLHLLQSMSGSMPSQSLSGPIICLCTLYTAFVANFGLMAYIEFRRHRNRKSTYRRSGKIAPADLILQFNYTEDPQNRPDQENLPPEMIREQSELEPSQGLEVRRSDKSGESLVHESKFQSLKSRSNKSREHSLSDTHKKIAVPHAGRNQQTKQKSDPYNDGFIVIRQPVREIDYSGQYEERSVAERVEVLDMSRSVSDFTKTKPKFMANETFGAQPTEEYPEQRHQQDVEEEGVEGERDPEPSRQNQYP